ncbi:MAG TPA: hypothetical protein PLO23_01245 [Alphaproteobacteria bacterium]|nr:hypothetical protein [Alphaproteobacteria bacterium]
MIFCSCRNISDKTFVTHLRENFSGAVADPEVALESCTGCPKNCGKCYAIAEELVRDHNKRVATVRELSDSLPVLSKRSVEA